MIGYFAKILGVQYVDIGIENCIRIKVAFVIFVKCYDGMFVVYKIIIGIDQST